MEFDYIINNDAVDKYLSDFKIILDHMTKAKTDFEASAFSSCNNSKVKKLYSKVDKEITSLEESIRNIYLVWNEYVQDVESLENSLSDFNVEGLDAPIGFEGDLSRIVDTKIDPVLNGEYVDNRSLGFKKNSEDFLNKYKGTGPGQCVTGFVDYLKYMGIYDDICAYAKTIDPNFSFRVDRASDYYTNPKIRQCLEQYFDLEDVTSLSELQDGDWLIFEKPATYTNNSHVGMYYQGMLFGRNQTNSNSGAGSSFTLNDAGLGAQKTYSEAELGKYIHVYRLKQYKDEVPVYDDGGMYEE